jgi:excisionase family DNA binding protein
MPLPGVISLPVDKAASLVGRSKRTLYLAIQNGHLKAYRPWTNSKDVPTGRMLVMVSDLESWVQSNPVHPADVEASDGAA